MTQKKLQGLRVAILVIDNFDQSGLVEPKKALEQAGAQAQILSPQAGEVQGMKKPIHLK